jgi:hypothetical protein
MSLGMRMLGAGLVGAAVSLGNAPVATAEPVWPVAGAESASATIDDLEAQGYDVRINWVSVSAQCRCRGAGHGDP